MQGHNGEVVKFNCLLDTASSRSYISQNVSEKLNLNKDLCKNVDYKVKTFLGSGVKALRGGAAPIYFEISLSS